MRREIPVGAVNWKEADNAAVCFMQRSIYRFTIHMIAVLSRIGPVPFVLFPA
jgi:hypothetical protein